MYIFTIFSDCSGEMLRYLGVYLSPIIPCTTIDPEAEQYIVYYDNHTPDNEASIETSSVGTSTVPPLIPPTSIPRDMEEFENESNGVENTAMPEVSQPKNLRRPWNATESATQTTNQTGDHLPVRINIINSY